jgi:hypothetical protein
MCGRRPWPAVRRIMAAELGVYVSASQPVVMVETPCDQWLSFNAQIISAVVRSEGRSM